MTFIYRLFIWFASEAVSYGLSEAVAESISKNPYIFYPILILLFSLASVASTILIFRPYLKNLK